MGVNMTKVNNNFEPCAICGGTEWEVVYRGSIREGVFGTSKENATVAKCKCCEVQRLAEKFCVDDLFYETDAYRHKLQQELNSEAYFSTHDELQIHTLKTIWPTNLRDKTVADIGCAAGSLLDHLRGYTENQIGIEPYGVYRESLASRGYSTYQYASDALESWAGRVDMAFSMQVIEHTANPRAFLEEIRPLLAPQGRLVISTPNLRDILFDLLPEEFPAFFYRMVHRWYFDALSLSNCAQMAGYKVVQMRPVHRYGMANALHWLRDCKPSGHRSLPGIDALADDFWRAYLERSGRSDCLFAVLQPNDN